MVQEFNVLRCFSCRTFQVHQVKKSKKWNCKMCGEKQSLVKVYGHGSGADCRHHVQKLNSLRGELHEAEHACFSREPEGEEEELQDEGDKVLPCGNEQGVAGTVSRWGKYLTGTGEEAGTEEAEEEENVYADRNAYRNSRPERRKRKRSWAFSPPPPPEESAGAGRGGAGQSAAEDPWSGARRRTQREGKRDSHSGSWAASKITHDASVTSRQRPAAEALPPLGASRVEPEVTSSKWSRFLSVRCEDDEEEEEEDEEEEAPERDMCAGTSRGRAGIGKPQGFPSIPSPVFTDRFEEHGHFGVREEVHLTNRMCVGNSARSPENAIDSLKFSTGYRGTQKVANDRDRPSHLNSGLGANAAPLCPQTLPISKPHPSVHSLFQTDEDFDDTF